MPPLIETLQVLDECARPGGPAWNMAMDEALLSEAAGPVLRLYRWAAPALSFGYFLRWDDAVAAAGGATPVRRWTGGGMVPHGADFTWSLILPMAEPVCRLRPVESYTLLHGALACALRETGCPVHLVDPAAPVPAGGLCFQAPAPGDVLLHGQKIAGAGQRRCRFGLLHQGSVAGVPLPEDFGDRLAGVLSRHLLPFPADRLPLVRQRAQELVNTRYGTESWLRRR